MNEDQLQVLTEVIEEGITKGIEQVGIENVDWCNIRLQE